jgi:hypothetical protein
MEKKMWLLGWYHLTTFGVWVGSSGLFLSFSQEQPPGVVAFLLSTYAGLLAAFIWSESAKAILGYTAYPELTDAETDAPWVDQAEDKFVQHIHAHEIVDPGDEDEIRVGLETVVANLDYQYSGGPREYLRFPPLY